MSILIPCKKCGTKEGIYRCIVFGASLKPKLSNVRLCEDCLMLLTIRAFELEGTDTFEQRTC